MGFIHMKIPSPDLPRKPVYVAYDPGIPFYHLFRLVEHHFETAFLLESLGDNGYDSRYSVIGFDPSSLLRGVQGKLIIDGREYEASNPYHALREFLPHDIIASNYSGGLVGYLGYDSMNFFEPTLRLRSHPDFDPFVFGFYEDGLIHDKFTGET